MTFTRLEDMTEPELRHLMNTLARAVLATCQQLLVERPLFALVLFNDPALGQYVANCDRSSMIAALRETADRLASREDISR